MIPLTRDRTKVHKSYKGADRIENALELLEFDSDGKRIIDTSYWKKAKTQLKKEAFGKCAYCEESAATVAHCDVEHYRPKSVYWWLAYCYDNYLFSCQLCNQSFKKDFFPLHSQAQVLLEPVPVPAPNASIEEKRAFVSSFAPDPTDNPTVQAFDAICVAEDALLINPYSEDPSEIFTWSVNNTNRTVDVAPRAGGTTAETNRLKKRLDAAVQFYGLNRPELRFGRWSEYSKLELFVTILGQGVLDLATTESTKNIIRMMTEPSAPFAGMSRYFVYEVWNVDLD